MDITYVKAVFGSLRKTRTQPVYRDDHDLILQLVGVKGLPVHFQAHFSNTEYGTAVVMMGSDGEVSIPNTLLATGLPVYCWILVEQGISGAVRYSVQIPVRQKARPDGTITPEQADIISQAISALNDAGTSAQEAADSAAQNAEYVAGVKDDLYEAIDRVGVLEEAKETTLEAAGNAEAWAVGNRGGSAVPSTDPAYHNNAKYYAEQAAESARTLTTDDTLTKSGKAADARAVGTVIDGIKNVIDLSDKIPINYSIVRIGYIQSNGGANANATTAKYTDYIDISGLEKIVYTRRGVSASTTAHYDAFYDANKEFISSRRNLYNQESDGYTEVEYTLPEGAAYARFTIWADTDTYGNFAIYRTDNVLVEKFSELEAENARTEQVASSNTDAINKIVSDFYIANTYSVDEWTTGGISTSGSNTSATNRKRNSVRLAFVDFSDEEDNLAITVKDGYQAQLYEYYDTGGSLSTSNFKQILLVWAGGDNTVTISKGLAYRVALKKSDDSEFTESDNLTGAVIFKTQKSQDLYANSTIVGRNDPVLMEEKLIQLNRATRIPSTKTLGTPPFCLLHFSDIHGDAKCLQNVIAFHKHYANLIDDMIHTGDNVTEYSTDGIEFWDDTAGAEKILNCIGNHDTRITGGGSTDWIALSMAESYDAYFAPYIEEWGATYQSGKTYYYKDYAAKKIRLIVLDIMHQTAEQLEWFVETLASAKTAELHVICACHSRAHWQYTSYETPWDDKAHSPEYSGGYSYGDTSGNHGSSYPSNMSNDYADAVDDFISDGGNFVCWIHGHTHYKMFATLTAHPNQLEIAVANASRPQYAWTYVWARKDGTKSEDDFNILAVDTYSKILRIAKVGVDYDRYMRHVDTISYDYGNHNLLYSG